MHTYQLSRRELTVQITTPGHLVHESACVCTCTWECEWVCACACACACEDEFSESSRNLCIETGKPLTECPSHASPAVPYELCQVRSSHARFTLHTIVFSKTDLLIFWQIYVIHNVSEVTIIDMNIFLKISNLVYHNNWVQYIRKTGSMSGNMSHTCGNITRGNESAYLARYSRRRRAVLEVIAMAILPLRIHISFISIAYSHIQSFKYSQHFLLGSNIITHEACTSLCKLSLKFMSVWQNNCVSSFI